MKKVFGVDKILFWVLISPVMILLFFFFIGPSLIALLYSFTDQKLVGQASDGVSFIGFDNYFRMLADYSIVIVIKNSLAIILAVIIFQQCLGFLLAISLKDIKPWFKKIVHACVYAGWLMPEVAVAFVFFLLFSTDGNINSLLANFSVKGPVWLMDYPKLVLIIAILWSGLANTLIVYEQALSSLDKTIIDAAHSDGAHSIQIFFYIILPYMFPVCKRNSISIALHTLGIFGLIYVLTGGGPLQRSTNIPVYIFNTAISGSDTGYGLALAFLLFFMGMSLSFLQLHVCEEYES